MGKAQVQRVGRQTDGRTDGQTDMPISVQEQNLHLSAACAKADKMHIVWIFLW